jgi:hypothetical protein
MKIALPVFRPKSPLGTRKVLTLCALCFCLLCADGLAEPAASGVAQTTTSTFITFAPPDAGTYTFPSAISQTGAVAGSYGDAGNSFHGFVRASNGTITEFDAPGAETNGTYPTAVNSTGEVAGYYIDTDNVDQGFVRDPNGTVTTFNVGGAWTSVGGINDSGEITGYSAVLGIEADNGYLRTSDGTVTTFEEQYVTVPFGINTSGVIGGYYLDSSLIYHGFVRTGNGHITSFNLPGGSGMEQYVGGINAAGEVAGYYFDGNTSIYHGFVRATTGKITTFEAPGSGIGYSQGTIAVGISTDGSVTGYYLDSNGLPHGFVRASNGKVTDFDVPGGSQTIPSAISASGYIAGYYLDTNNVYRGFIRTP